MRGGAEMGGEEGVKEDGDTIYERHFCKVSININVKLVPVVL